jgi:8-oxo-dGTP pyrophosphatase MutT (NUDIX family)
VRIVSSVASPSPNVQYAALPWRVTRGTLEILLITTLSTKRWIVPKGWPLKNLSPPDCAAHEALEEAGVEGEIAAKPIGSFDYTKQRKNGEGTRVRVQVYAMQVAHQRRSWAEKRARETHWYSVEEALARVSEPGLRRVIASFANASRRFSDRSTAPANGKLRSDRQGRSLT